MMYYFLVGEVSYMFIFLVVSGFYIFVSLCIVMNWLFFWGYLLWVCNFVEKVFFVSGNKVVDSSDVGILFCN